MINEPKISIVLPTYNGERWLAHSIRSVINQTEKDWELIIVNDCSTDNTLGIATYFSKTDKRISIISNNRNRKLPASLNIGFSHVKGKYLTWTSDDNLYKPQAIEKMSKYLDMHPETDMVVMGQDFIDENGNIITVDDKYAYKNNRRVEELIYRNNVTAGFMYRKSIAEAVGLYDEFTFCAEDYDYWCRIALAGKIDYTTDNIYQYRINPFSLSATKRPEIIEKTKYIRRKYSEDFMKKFNYTLLDKIIFWAGLKGCTFPKKYFVYLLLFKIYHLFVHIIVLTLFWNRQLRRKVRKSLSINNYSFYKAEK